MENRNEVLIDCLIKKIKHNISKGYSSGWDYYSEITNAGNFIRYSGYYKLLIYLDILNDNYKLYVMSGNNKYLLSEDKEKLKYLEQLICDPTCISNLIDDQIKSLNEWLAKEGIE